MPSYNFGNSSFLNPYNFISLGDKPNRGELNNSKDNEQKYTGYFVCKLDVKTPLAVPDALKAEPDPSNSKHKINPFFRLGDQVAIPGSSIRGMLRSVYEAATNSCMVTLDEKEHITKRMKPNEHFDPGVLIKEANGWKLYKAERIVLVGETQSGYREIQGNYKRYDVKNENGVKYILVSGDKLYWGDEVEFSANGPGHRKKNDGPEVWNGKSVSSLSSAQEHTGNYLFLGEWFGSKHAESVFSVVKNAQPISKGIESAMVGLENTLKMYRSESVNKNLESGKHLGYRGYERAKNNGVIPLWYKEENNVVYLSLAATGRRVYYKTLKDLVDGHESCTSRGSRCPACSVFGMVGTNGDGIGSKVRVTDAIANEGIELAKKTLKVLGTPRTSYLQFYSTGGKSYDDEGATIRGRKFYWHIPAAAKVESIYGDSKKTPYNGTFEMVKKGQFIFRVYYDALTREQVDMLKKVITLDNDMCHKLGHGKPLGLGSVKITIDKQCERTVDWDGREDGEAKEYKIVSVQRKEAEQSSLIDKDAWKQLQTILEFDSDDSTKIKICYPYVEKAEAVKEKVRKNKEQGQILKDNNIDASHQWFRRNNGELPLLMDAKGNLQKALVLNNVDDGDFKRGFNKQNPRSKNGNH